MAGSSAHVHNKETSMLNDITDINVWNTSKLEFALLSSLKNAAQFEYQSNPLESILTWTLLTG